MQKNPNDYFARKYAERILRGEEVGNDLARVVLWGAHDAAGEHGLTRFERGLFEGMLIVHGQQMGAEPWVLMSVRNQINMLKRS